MTDVTLWPYRRPTKEWWQNKTCKRCAKKGHPAYACKEDDESIESINKKRVKELSKTIEELSSQIVQMKVE